jgi:hyperosmotically inducible periplasmic protein
MTRMKLIAVMTLAVAGLAQASNAVAPVEPQDMEKKIRRELLMLPWLSIYDNLSFRVDGAGKVTLMGETVRPVLKSDAGNIVKRLPGVTGVDNQIEVLPLSPNDDRIRLAVARAIYGFPALNRYALGANPSIRVIVKNGNVTLKGVVANEMDSNLAFIRANGVSGAFQVENQLTVESRLVATR